MQVYTDRQIQTQRRRGLPYPGHTRASNNSCKKHYTQQPVVRRPIITLTSLKTVNTVINSFQHPASHCRQLSHAVTARLSQQRLANC